MVDTTEVTCRPTSASAEAAKRISHGFSEARSRHGDAVR